MQEGKRNWTLSRTVSVLLVVFEPFDPSVGMHKSQNFTASVKGGKKVKTCLTLYFLVNS